MMDTVTIRVSKALRDDKNRRAKEGMVQAMKTNSPDQSYLKEAEEWQSDRFS